jgi:Tol biopolymer transport system component
LPSGHLVYVHQGVLFGVAFDADRLELLGAPAPVVEDLAGNATRGGGQFDFSETGTLLYLAGKGASQRWPVVWLDGSGKSQTLMATPGVYDTPRFSPDGQQLALISSGDLIVYDLRRDATTRLTYTGQALEPIWTPDGKHIAFQSVSSAGTSLLWIRVGGSGETERLLESPTHPIPYSFSPDGQRLAYVDLASETGYDIWTLPLDSSGNPDRPTPGRPELFLRTPFNETVPSFSPDGRWIVYRSNESGANEIYVRPFPASQGKWQISAGGGIYGIWSNNGRELFYETPDNRIMVVDYTASDATFVSGKPRPWSDRQIYYTGLTNLALAPDGKRFAVFPRPDTIGSEKGTVHVTFLLNFFDELRRRLPGRQ